MKKPRTLFVSERELELARTKDTFNIRREIPKQPDHARNDKCHSVDLDDEYRIFTWWGGQPYTQTIYHQAPNRIGRLGEIVTLKVKDQKVEELLFEIEDVQLNMIKNIIDRDATHEGFSLSHKKPPMFRYSVFCQNGAGFATNTLPVLGEKFANTSIRDFVTHEDEVLSPVDQWRNDRLRRGLTLNPEHWTVAAKLRKVTP